MALPPTFLDDLRNRLSLANVVGRKVTWDMRRSNQAKGDWWAPCPFHQEKTASFHVEDRKGFYYCFGCHAKGDMISFVRETENVSFMEAVEILAREAGMEMPARDPRAAERADRRQELSDVLEAAAGFYALQLRTAAARDARDYLARRGLDEDVQGRWQMGLAPAGRDTVLRHLAERGITAADVVEAGLAIRPEDGRAPYDRFRDRIMIPIRDGRGRIISFGGRALDPAARAKYLNGPETILFDKGRTLFNLDRARAFAGKAGPLIVAEGYMDVIALHEAGFAAVAPLGTAVTEDQLRLMWRVDDEPVVALDGDEAGLRAALRLIDIALPSLEAGKGLRFALLPGGMDPDDLIRAQGTGAMRALVESAAPMVRLLWQRETAGRVFDSPERRAALDLSLGQMLARIRDPSIRAHYRDALRELRQTWLRPPRRRWSSDSPSRPPAAPLHVSLPGNEDHLREAVILAAFILNPAVSSEFIDDLEMMDCRAEGHAAVRDALLTLVGEADLRGAVAAKIGDGALEPLFATGHVMLCPAVARPGDDELARQTLQEEFGKLRARRGHSAAIEEAKADISTMADEWLTRRLSDAAAAIDVTRPRETEDLREVDVAPNGLAIDREERELLDRIVEGIEFQRKRGR